MPSPLRHHQFLNQGFSPGSPSVQNLLRRLREGVPFLWSSVSTTGDAASRILAVVVEA